VIKVYTNPVADNLEVEMAKPGNGSCLKYSITSFRGKICCEGRINEIQYPNQRVSTWNVCIENFNGWTVNRTKKVNQTLILD
jgi:hypothetical protein